VGLIDVEKPDESKILQFINRRPDEPNLITDKMRQQGHPLEQATEQSASRLNVRWWPGNRSSDSD